jgi:hypothetical protein
LSELAEIVAFEPDLIFSSRIESTAEKERLKVRIVTDYEDLSCQLATEAPSLLLLNLDVLEGNIRRLEQFARNENCRIIGYYSHVNGQLAAGAKQIGIDVFSRGSFMIRLPDLLREFASA